MSKIDVPDDEYKQMVRLLQKLDIVSQRANLAISQREEALDAVNTAWRSCARGQQLMHPDVKDMVIPDMIVDDDRQVVKLNPTDRTGEWTDLSVDELEEQDAKVS